MTTTHQAAQLFMVAQSERATKFRHNVLREKTKEAATIFIKKLWTEAFRVFILGQLTDDQAQRIGSESLSEIVSSIVDEITRFCLNTKSSSRLPLFEWALLTKLLPSKTTTREMKQEEVLKIFIDLMLKGFADYCLANQVSPKNKKPRLDQHRQCRVCDVLIKDSSQKTIKFNANEKCGCEFEVCVDHLTTANMIPKEEIEQPTFCFEFSCPACWTGGRSILTALPIEVIDELVAKARSAVPEPKIKVEIIERDYVSEVESEEESSHHSEHEQECDEHSDDDRSGDLFSDDEEEQEQRHDHSTPKTVDYESDEIGNGDNSNDDDEDMFGNLEIEPSQAPRSNYPVTPTEVNGDLMVTLFNQMNNFMTQMQVQQDKTANIVVDMREMIASVVKDELRKSFPMIDNMFQKTVTEVKTSIGKSSDQLAHRMERVQDEVITSFNNGRVVMQKETMEMHQITTSKIENVAKVIDEKMSDIKKHIDLSKAAKDYDRDFAMMREGMDAIYKEMSAAKEFSQVSYFLNQQQQHQTQMQQQQQPEVSMPMQAVPQIDVNSMMGYQQQQPEVLPTYTHTRKRTFEQMIGTTNEKPKRGQCKTCHNCNNREGHEKGIAKTCPNRICLICLEKVEMNNTKTVAVDGVKTGIPIMLSCQNCDEVKPEKRFEHRLDAPEWRTEEDLPILNTMHTECFIKYVMNNYPIWDCKRATKKKGQATHRNSVYSVFCSHECFKNFVGDTPSSLAEPSSPSKRTSRSAKNKKAEPEVPKGNIATMVTSFGYGKMLKERTKSHTDPVAWPTGLPNIYKLLTDTRKTSPEMEKFYTDYAIKRNEKMAAQEQERLMYTNQFYMFQQQQQQQHVPYADTFDTNSVFAPMDFFPGEIPSHQ